MKAKRNRCCMAHRSHIATVASFGLVLLLVSVTSAPALTAFDEEATLAFPTEGRQ